MEPGLAKALTVAGAPPREVIASAEGREVGAPVRSGGCVG